MKFCVTTLYPGFQRFTLLPWVRLEHRVKHAATWPHDWEIHPVGLIVHWLWWQFHLVWGY